MKIKNLINWKSYWVLLIATVVSIIAILPYILIIQADLLNNLPVPLPLALFLSVLQSTLLFAVLLFIGLRLSEKLEFKLPIIDYYLNKKNTEINIKKIVKTSVSLGVLAGVLIVLFDFLFSQLGVNLISEAPAPIWQGFLASFYGGISEEIVMRLFFMTLLVWLFSKLIKNKNKIIENSFIIWFSIIISAVLFGLGHLPVTATLTELTPLVISRAILLNGIGGIIFGWLYWKKGLESAMIAHFSADIIIHVLLPIILLF